MNKHHCKMIFTFLLTALLCFGMSILTKEIGKRSVISEVQKGNFKIVSDTFDFIPSELVCYVPNQDGIHQQGKLLSNIAKMMDGYVYGAQDGKEMIGYYCPRVTESSKSVVIIQFEAYSNEDTLLEISFSGQEKNVYIGKEKRMFFIPFTGVERVKDVIFSVQEPKSEIVIKRLYIIDYGNKIDKDSIFSGEVIVPD